MFRWFMALGLMLASAAPVAVSAQTGSPLPNPDPYGNNKSPRDSGSTRDRQWNQPPMPEQEQIRQRWEMENRGGSFDMRPNPTYKPGFEPWRPQQQQQQPKPSPDNRSR